MILPCPSCGYATPAEGEARCPRCGQPNAAPSTLRDPPPGEAPTLAPAPTSADTAGDGPPAFSAGTAAPAIPGYEILEELGRGGMGVVYKARQLTPRRLVALKVILAGEHAGADHLARFRTEAEAVARLQHPAIIQIHQVGEWQPESGPPLPYLTLEYVEGAALARRLAAGPRLAVREAADLVRQIALGVHYAHTRGILHRDLKPGNILLVGGGGWGGAVEEPDDSTPPATRHPQPATLCPKIVDFGLAKPLEGVGSVAAGGAHTQTGAILGTPSYMAPEQADGSGRALGPAADVYALGVLLYECLAGRPPFEAATTLDTLLRVVQEEPPPLRRVPRELNTICLKCLEKDPTRRYATAADLAEDLRRFLAGEPIRNAGPSAVRRLTRWARRRKEVVYLLSGALATAVVVTVVALLRASMAPPEPEPTTPAVVSPDPDPDADARLRDAVARITSANNLKQLGLALHNYDSTYATFPPPAILDKKDGKQLLSWRVLVLPFIEQEALYKQFKLDEPWDGANNKKLLPLMPKTFATDGRTSPEVTATHYQAVVGKGAAWERTPDAKVNLGAKGLRITDFTDGTSNTILLVEAADAVPWTKPDDVAFEPNQLPRLGGVFKGGFNALRADGSVLFLPENISAATLRAGLTRQGGEVVELDANTPIRRVTGRDTKPAAPPPAPAPRR